MKTLRFVLDYYDFSFYFVLKSIFLSMTTSPDKPENNEENNSTLIAAFAPLALGDQILHPESTLNGNSIPDDISTHSSDINQQNEHNHRVNHMVRPFVDPGLIIQKRKQANETWLSDFVSPKSAPQGAYSPLSQAVKKLLPERTACRLG